MFDVVLKVAFVEPAGAVHDQSITLNQIVDSTSNQIRSVLQLDYSVFVKHLLYGGVRPLSYQSFALFLIRVRVKAT